MDYVLIHAPGGRLPAGMTLRGSQNDVRNLQLQGVPMLPVLGDLMGGDVACCPFTIAHWGKGLDFNANRGERGCPMLLYVPGRELSAEVSAVHWMAQLERIEGAPLSGTLSLVSNPNQPGAMQGGLVSGSGAVDLAASTNGYAVPGYGRGAAGASWIVGGSYGLRVQSGGYLGLCLYAVARGVRVLWSAASLA